MSESMSIGNQLERHLAPKAFLRTEEHCRLIHEAMDHWISCFGTKPRHTYVLLGQSDFLSDFPLPEAVRTILEKVDNHQIRIAGAAFAKWELNPLYSGKQNPFGPILEFLTSGGSYSREEQGILDIYDSFNGKSGLSLRAYRNA